MASTPEIVCSTVNRISPFGSGVNKSFFTPCRPVGLSRKRKTPISIGKNSDNLNNSNNNLEESSLTETTPVNHIKSLSRKRNSLLKVHSSPRTILAKNPEEKVLETNTQTLQEDDHNISKKYLFEKFSSEDLFSSPGDIPSEESIIKNTLEHNLLPVESELSTDDVLGTKNFIAKEELSSVDLSFEIIKTKTLKRNIRKLSDDDFLSSESIHKKASTGQKSFDFESDSDEDFQISSKSDFKRKQQMEQRMEDTRNVKKPKKIKKKLFMSNSLSVTDEFKTGISKGDDSKNNIKDCKIRIHRLSDDEIYVSEKNKNICNPIEKSSENITKSVNRDNDDDAFTFTPEQEKKQKINLLKKIKILESQIKQKQQKLTNLKQASIYKNKHDVENLKRLTSQWANGCVDGLNDLLAQLQTHGPMSMTMLINNLHIPSKMIARLPLSNE